MEISMSEMLLKAENLCKSFANNGEQNHVLNMINVDIYEKDFTVIMGASGSGKSTFLYSVSGMDSITAGKAYFKDQVISDYKEKQTALLRSTDFGFIFQQIHLVNNLTLFENVAVPGYLNKKVSAKDVNSRAKELLDSVGLSDKLNRLPSQVSGGEQQRCAIARALISSPKMLFADEPTGALNKKTGTEVLDLLTAFNNEGQSILMVTHDVRAAIRADRLLYLEDGNIIGEMRLPHFNEQNSKDRETQVTAWLSSMAW